MPTASTTISLGFFLNFLSKEERMERCAGVFIDLGTFRNGYSMPYI